MEKYIRVLEFPHGACKKINFKVVIGMFATKALEYDPN